MGESVVLETERIILRNFAPDDADALALVIGDPITMQFYAAPFNREGVEQWIARNIVRYATEGHGLWALVLKSSGELIGDCGCVAQVVEDRQEVEVAYHVRRDLWGRGYATEAARACMDYAFSKLGVERLISMIRPGNFSSRRVAEKNGLVCNKVIFWHGFDHCLYVAERS